MVAEEILVAEADLVAEGKDFGHEENRGVENWQ